LTLDRAGPFGRVRAGGPIEDTVEVVGDIDVDDGR
jgi:hypothetical protein